MSSALVRKKPAQSRRKRTRLWLGALLVVLLAAFIGLLNSPLAVRFALRFVNLPGFTLRTDEIGGTLWRPELRGVNIQGPGVRGRARTLTLSYDVAALTRQELKFSLKLSNAELELDPSKFASTPASSPTTSGGTAWKILPQSLELNRVRVKVRGSPYTLPDGTISLKSFQGQALEGQGNAGKAELGLQTRDGQAQARVTYALEPLAVTADFEGDAALANHWWPGIKAGTLAGQYRYQNDVLEGDVKVSGGRVQIPGLEKLVISDVSGKVTHRGNVVGFSARGQGFDGPLKATGAVNYLKQRWDVRGTVQPRLEPLFNSLIGLKGVSGQPSAQVTASGWTTARVKVQATGDAAFEGVPIPRVNADYTFQNGQSTLKLEGDLRALGEAQSAKVTLRSAGKLWNGSGQLEGRLLQAPVSATARLEGNALSARGVLLSSAVDAVYDLETGQVKGHWDGLIPYLKNSVLKGSFAGPLEQVQVQIDEFETDLPGLRGKSYRGTGYAGTKGYGLDLGVAKLDLNPDLTGSWQVQRFELPQTIVAAGAGTLDLKASTLEGTATLSRLPVGITPLSGPLSLDWKRSRADWKTKRANLRWDGKSIEATLENLSVQAGQRVSLSGPLKLDLSTQNWDGRLEAVTNGGQATLEAKGRTLELKGRFRGFALSGQGNLNTLQATLEGRNKNLVVSARYNKTLDFTALSGKNLDSRVNGTFDLAKGLEGLKAQGQIDLSAFESFGLKGLEGVVNADARGEQITARANYQGFDISAKGNLKNLTAQLEATKPNLKISAQYNETLEFTALSGLNLSSKIKGTFNLAKGLEGLKAQGNLDLNALESFGVKGLNGVVSARANGQNITARANYQGFDISATGNLKTLTAQLEANRKNLKISARYNKTLEFTALSGPNLNSRVNGTFDLSKGLDGLKTQGQIDLSALESFGVKGLEGVVNARADGQNITARANYQGFDISAKGSLKNLTAQLEATKPNLKISAQYNKTLEFTALSGKNLDSRVNGTFDLPKGLEGLKAQGQIDLSAFESFGLKGFEGVVNADARGEQITARANYQGFDISAKGNLKTLTAQLEAKQKNLEIMVQYDKTLEFTALSGPNLNSRVNGTFDLSKGLDGLKAQGQIDLSALESFGVKGLEGVVNARADGQNITARANYRGFDISAKGSLKNLTAQLEATKPNLKISARYNKTLEFTALSGLNLNSRVNGTLDLTKGLEGFQAQGNLDLSALESFGFQGLQGVVNADARGEQITARANYRGFDISAKGNLKTQTAQLEARGRGLSFAGRYDKSLVGTLSSGAGQTVNLNWSPANGFVAKGNVALEALKAFDIKAVGTLSLEASGKDLMSARGVGRVSGEAYGALVQGDLTLNAGAVTAQLEGDYQGVTAKLLGQVYPKVQAGGTLEYSLRGVLERVNTQLSGEYGALRLALRGTNAPRTESGLKIPAQTLTLEGQLSPQVAVKGKWGDLALEYDGKKALFDGQIPLEYSGQALELRAKGDWQPDFSGALEARVSGLLGGEMAALELKGPWKALELRGNWPRYGTQLSGRAALPDLTYDATATAKVQGYPVSLTARGKGTDYALEGLVQGDEGGLVRLTGRDLNAWSARAENFQTQGARVGGLLENGPGGLNGSLEASVRGVPIALKVSNNRLSATGEYSGVRGTLEAVLDLNTLEARNLSIGLKSRQYGTLSATGQYSDGKAALELRGNALQYGSLRGSARYVQGKATLEATLSTLAQAFNVAGQTLTTPPQSARVNAAWDGKTTLLSLTDAQTNVLRLEENGLRGSFGLPYALNGNAGRVLLNADRAYRLDLTGPLKGQINLDTDLQKLSAKLEAQLTSLKLDLPADLKLGRLALEALGARSSLKGNFSLLDSQYQNLPVKVSGTGIIELDSNFNLRSYSARLSGDLKPFTALLPLELRSSTSLGTLEATVQGQGQGQGTGVSATYALKGSAYAGRPLSLTGRASLENGPWTVRGDLEHPQLGVQLEARADGLVLNRVRADVALLEPYLKQNLSGQLKGNLVLPAYTLARAQGNLSGTVKRGADSVSGGINAVGGVWSVNLLGTALEKPLRVQGNLYPRASARLGWDGLSGTLEGDTTRASARVQGRTFGRSVDLSAALASNALSVLGTVDGVSVKAGAKLENGLKGTLEASASDLRPLVGLAGNLELKATFENLNAKGTARGVVAGYAVNAPLEFTDGKLNVSNASLEGLLTAGRSVSARASGQVYPRLGLSAKASVSGDLPAQASFALKGEYTAPRVTATGALEIETLALGPDYRVKTGRVPFTANLENTKISLQLEGTAISGTVQATLEGGLKLLSAQARLNEVALEGRDTAVQANGALEWTPSRGLSADLKASGTLLGQNASLTAGGTGALELAGSLGQGRFKATLGRDILERPSGTVALERIDVARLWGRPDALGLSANLELAGTYAQPQGKLSGTLEDRAGVLSGRLEGQVSTQDARVTLEGAKIKGWGRWSFAAVAEKGPPQQAWSARVSALGADVSHLLPPDWNYGALWLSGTVDATPTSLEVKGLDARVENADLGKLRALGDLSWSGNEPVGKLRLEGLGGNATLEGKLSAGASLTVNKLNLSKWQLGRVSGSGTLRGALGDPTLKGIFQVAGRYARGEVQVSGRVLDPQISARGDLLQGVEGPFTAQLSNLKLNPLNARVSLKATLLKPVQGKVSLEAQDFEVQKLTARVKLEADLKQSGNTLKASLNGLWPALEGSAQVTVAQLETPIEVQGQGNGTYTLEGGALGKGILTLEGTQEWLPRVRANLALEPLSLLSAELRKNLKGTVAANLTLEGELLKPTIALEGTTQALEYAGVRLDDLTLKGGGKLEDWTDFSKWSVALEQGGQSVGQANLNSVTLEGLKAKAFSSDLSLSGSYGASYGAKGTEFRLSSVGQITGRLAGMQVGDVLSGDYDLAYGAYGVKGTVRNLLGGSRALSGSGTVRGLPADVVDGAANFTLAGTLDAPTLNSSLNLLGAKATLEAGLSSASLELANGPLTQAAGTLSWSAGKLGGEVALQRQLSAGVLSDPVSGTLRLAGTLEQPAVSLSAQYRNVKLQGNGTLEAGKVVLSTGSENGSLSWQGQTVTSDLKAFDLSSLNLPGYSGLLELVGSLDLGRQKGKLALGLENLKTPFTVPYLDLPLAGSAKGTLELSETAQLDLSVQTVAGTLEVSANNARGWRGQARANLKAPQGGTLKGTVTLEGLEKPSLSGALEASGVQLDLAGTPLSVDGKVAFSGQDFTVSGLLEAGGGKLRLEGDGAVADFVPALSAVGLSQSENGYQVRASLDSVNLKNIKVRGLKLPDYLQGRVSGGATFAESVSTFALRSEALTLAGEELPARLEGSFSGGNLRLRGGFGDSSVVGNVTNGQLSARIELVKTPLHAIIGAFSGPLPGKSYATGAVRYRGRLDNLLGGQLEAVAENLSVEGGSQTLRGSGQLEYASGILKIPGISLSGAGQVQVRGEYSPEKVDFTADFIGTNFTPLLKLVPALKTLEPSLRGTVQVRIGGSFEKPSAVVKSQNLEGSFAGIAVKSSGLEGELNGNLLELGGNLSASSAFTADGVVSAKANLSVRGISNAQVIWNGKGKIDNFGPLEGVKALLAQSAAGDRWIVQASGKQGGTLTVAGEVAPKLALEFNAQNVTPVVGPLFIKGATLSARGTFERLTGNGSENGVLDNPSSSSTSGVLAPNPTNPVQPGSAPTGLVPAPLEATGNSSGAPNLAPTATSSRDRYRLSGSADFSSLLFGAVTTPATPTDPNAPKTPAGTLFVSPLPDELTTFPRAKPALKRAPSFLEQLEFDNFDLNASRGGVKVDENLARAEFAGRLTLGGSGATPRLAGKLTPVRGSVFLRENEFVLDNSTTLISFDPAEGIYPKIVLNAKALNKVKLQNREVTLRVQVKGDFITVKTVTPLEDGTSESKDEKKLQLDTTLSTDTGITCSSTDLGVQCGELYALLATGSSDLTSLAGNLTQSALKTAVNVFVIGELERGIARALNLSVFRIRTNALEFGNDLKADFTVGTYLTKEFYLQYQVDLQGNGLLDAQYTTADGKFTFNVNTPIQWLDLSKAKPTFGLSYNLDLNPRSSLQFGVQTGSQNGNELKLLLNYKFSF